MRALRPLRRSAYRRLASALALSVLAEGLWTLAVVWQVVELGGGPVELSLVSGALALGVIVTALLGACSPTACRRSGSSSASWPCSPCRSAWSRASRRSPP
jgi:hypothetical protein